MDFTFVAQYDGQTPKKRRLAKACESCRARKKRCYHHPIEQDDLPEQSPQQEKRSDDRNGYQGISIRKAPNNSRFLSDLSPETRLLERTTTANSENGLAKNMDSVGIWVDRSEYESLVRERNAARGVNFRPGQPEPPTKLDAAQVNGLVDVYFAKVHPFLPILEEADFRQAKTNGTLPSPLLDAVCLVALKDSAAEQYFKTTDTEWTPRHLCKTLHASIKAAVSTFPRQDKITYICLLGVLSLHIEGPDGGEEASLYLMQAIHHCQTLGLHLSASFPARDGNHTKRLFWCLWILDRFSSATHGRPILAADNDIAIEQFLPGESDFPAFEILFRIANILNQVISYYRPGNPPETTGWEMQYPGFDEIVSKHAGWSLPPSLLSTLHIAYLTVTILSHRSKGTADFASTTPSYVRQTLAASRVIKLMSPARLSSLHALPSLPYAISLAMSVSYQHLRQDQLLHQQEDAKADFEACYVILRELRKTWSSADAILALSQKVVEELNRIPSLTAFRIKRSTIQDAEMEGISSACRHEGEAVRFIESGRCSASAQSKSNGTAQAQDQKLYTPTETDTGLFEGIDDIFGTYLDPNYPVNLDFLDGMSSLDPGEWTTANG